MEFCSPFATKAHSNSLWSNMRKSLYLTSMLFFAVFFSSGLFIHVAFAAGTPGCGFFEISPQCDISGWFHLILGDIVGGGLLALLFYRLSHRTQSKLEKIMELQEAFRVRRKDSSVINLKGLFNNLLFTIGVINKATSNFNKAHASETRQDQRLWIRGIMLSEIRSEEAKMGRILQSIRNTTIASNDVLEPELVSQIDGICTFIEEISAKEQDDGTMVYPKYEICKSKVKFLIEKLSTYTYSTHSFVEPESEYLEREYGESSRNSKKTPKATLVQGVT